MPSRVTGISVDFEDNDSIFLSAAPSSVGGISVDFDDEDMVFLDSV